MADGKVGSCSATDVQVLNRVCVECALLPATPLVTRDGPTPITADATSAAVASSRTPSSRRERVRVASTSRAKPQPSSAARWPLATNPKAIGSAVST